MDSKELEPEAWARPLYDGFEASDFSAEGGLYYKTNLEQSAGIVEFQNQVVYRGAGALKLSVGRPRVQATEMGSERAEIWERRDLWAPYDRGIWYGFAVKFAEPIPRDDHRYVIAQWKREIAGTKGDFSPFLALRLKRGKLFATVETNLLTGTGMGLMNQTGQFEGGSAKVWLRPETNQTRAFVAADDTWKNEDGACFDTYTREITIIDRGHPCLDQDPVGLILSSTQSLAPTAPDTSKSLPIRNGSQRYGDASVIARKASVLVNISSSVPTGILTTAYGPFIMTNFVAA
jgi:hypothetical protein